MSIQTWQNYADASEMGRLEIGSVVWLVSHCCPFPTVVHYETDTIGGK